MTYILIEKDIESTINGLNNVNYQRRENKLEFKFKDIVPDEFEVSFRIRKDGFSADDYNISIIKRVHMNDWLYILPDFIFDPIYKTIIYFSEPILQITFPE